VSRARLHTKAVAIDIEAEFDRFVEELLSITRRAAAEARPSSAQRRRAAVRPRSITDEQIYEYKLMLLDREGPQSLTARRLAAELGISTGTLYKRIGNHDNLILRVVELQLLRSAPALDQGGT
jgi:Bacterial regulatory proteins, tetR family